jgi:hypothetical protein
MATPRARTDGRTDTLAAMRIGSLALVVIATLARAAHGDPDVEKADRLFAEAKALLDSNLIQACARFDESLRANPAAIGTLLNVALCDEKLGRIASAVAKFTEARDRAKEQGLRQHVRAAEDHIAALEPKVPHLAIKLTQAMPETKVVLDDRVIAADSLDDVAVDPGERELSVSAPGRLPYRTKLVIAKSEHRDVIVPALATSITVTSSRRFVGQLTTIAGGVAFGTAIGLGLYGRHLRLQQFDNGNCTATSAGDLCSSPGKNQIDRARTLGNVGTAVGAIGLVAIGVGTYLWLTAPSSSSGHTHEPRDKTVTVVPSLSPSAFGVTALGRF